MNSLLKSLKEFDKNKDYVVAIIVDTKGSTYRKAGAMMLVSDCFTYWGLLSGGCLEGDIVEHCRSVFETKSDATIEYNLRDDEDWLWGMGLGCDGEITVLLKYLPAEYNHFGFIEMLTQIESGINQYLSVEKDNSLTIGKSQSENDDSIFNVELKAPHHLLVCGASPDVPPVTAIAHHIGWKTTVIDHKKASLNPQLFPLVDNLTHVKSSQLNDFNLLPFDSVIIMSHQYEKDRDYLKLLIKSQISYIGLLGPSKRRDKLLEDIGIEFKELESRLFGPIGLDLGAGSPEEIALAIISEIQAVKNGKMNNHQIGFCYQDVNR